MPGSMAAIVGFEARHGVETTRLGPRRSANTTAAAPLLTPGALPAVIVPSLRNAGGDAVPDGCDDQTNSAVSESSSEAGSQDRTFIQRAPPTAWGFTRREFMGGVGAAAMAGPAMAGSDCRPDEPKLTRICDRDYDVWRGIRNLDNEEDEKQCDQKRTVGQEWAVKVDFQDKCWIVRLSPFGPNAHFTTISSERELECKSEQNKSEQKRQYRRHIIAITSNGFPWSVNFTIKCTIAFNQNDWFLTVDPDKLIPGVLDKQSNTLKLSDFMSGAYQPCFRLKQQDAETLRFRTFGERLQVQGDLLVELCKDGSWVWKAPDDLKPIVTLKNSVDITTLQVRLVGASDGPGAWLQQNPGARLLQNYDRKAPALLAVASEISDVRIELLKRMLLE
jgi:hypothetical protein